MRIHSQVRWFVALAVLGYAASPAGAQTPSANGSATITLTGTPAQAMAEVEGIIAFIDSGSGSVQQKLMAARLAHDVVKALCLNDKLSQLDQTKQMAHGRKSSMQVSLGRGDLDTAKHERELLKMHQARVQQLISEANQCIGEESSYSGDTSTTVVVDSNIPADQGPGWFPPILLGNVPIVSGPGGIVVLPPGSVSPTK